MHSIAELLKSAEQRLTASDSPRLDAEVLLCHILGVTRSYLFTWPEKQPAEADQLQFNAFIARRADGEPVAYITGHREFWSMNLAVSPATLIPRPDTETLVALALQLGQQLMAEKKTGTLKVLDLGTGTGAIALALAVEHPTWQVSAVDRSVDAVALAEENVRRQSLSNVTVLQSDWFSRIKGQFDLIVSNPPYIDENDPHLHQGDVRFEPQTALIAEQGGLQDISLIIDQARQHLFPGGWLALEHGYQQGAPTAELFHQFGYTAVALEQDFGGQDRVSYAQYKNNER